MRTNGFDAAAAAAAALTGERIPQEPIKEFGCVGGLAVFACACMGACTWASSRRPLLAAVKPGSACLGPPALVATHTPLLVLRRRLTAMQTPPMRPPPPCGAQLPHQLFGALRPRPPPGVGLLCHRARRDRPADGGALRGCAGDRDGIAGPSTRCSSSSSSSSSGGGLLRVQWGLCAAVAFLRRPAPSSHRHHHPLTAPTATAPPATATAVKTLPKRFAGEYLEPMFAARIRHETDVYRWV
jgi:hypothetical protein